MERKPDQALSPRGREDPARGELDLLKGADRPDARAEKGSRLAEASDKAASKALAESVYNPLDAFMNSWISAHDREVLLPATRSDIPMAGELGRERAGTLPAVDLGQPGVFAEGAPPARDAGLADSKAATNPYVAAIDLAIFGPRSEVPPPECISVSGEYSRRARRRPATPAWPIRRPRRIPTLRTSTWRSWGPPSPSPPPTCPALRPSAFRIPPTGCPRGARTPSHWTPPDR